VAPELWWTRHQRNTATEAATRLRRLGVLHCVLLDSGTEKVTRTVFNAMNCACGTDKGDHLTIALHCLQLNHLGSGSLPL
jgi:hypothetical protein